METPENSGLKLAVTGNDASSVAFRLYCNKLLVGGETQAVRHTWEHYSSVPKRCPLLPKYRWWLMMEKQAANNLYKYRKLGWMWKQTHSGNTGVKVNAILLIIGSLSWLLTMTKTSRGGSRSRTATRTSGVFQQWSRALWGFQGSRHERSPPGCQNSFQCT